MAKDQQTLLGRLLTLILRPLIFLIYQVRVEGRENLPRAGGFIIASNHLSYVDGLLLGASSPRPLRAMTWGGFQRYAIYRVIIRIFGMLPITPTNAREALRNSVRILEEGGVILIFPEGQISRTGALQELAGGFNLLARRAQVPVVPACLDGIWGSIFSFSGGRFFWKWPRHFPCPVTVHFGRPLAPEQATVENLREAILALAGNPATTTDSTPGPQAPADFGETESPAR